MLEGCFPGTADEAMMEEEVSCRGLCAGTAL